MSTDHSMIRKRRRLVLLLFLGVTAIGGALFYVTHWHQRPIGAGPAGPVVPREPFETMWSDRPVELRGFGDSITAGFGASAGLSYFDRLVQNPLNEFGDMQGRSLSAVLPNLTVTNVSVSGSDSLEHADWMLNRTEPREEETFGIIVATVGGNDIIHMYGRTPPREGAMYGATLTQAEPWIAAYEVRLNTILDSLGVQYPGGHHIFLGNVYDPTDGTGDITNAGLPAWPDGMAIHAAYNDVIAKVAEQRDDTTLVDLYTKFLGHGIHCRQFWHPHYDSADPHYWYFDNLEDPNDRGYDAIRRLFLLAMLDVLPGRLRSDRAAPAAVE